MTQTNMASAGPTAMAPRWPRVVLLLAAAVELMSNLSYVAVLFGDTSQMAGASMAKIALAPLVAFAALFFTVRGRVAYALLAFAALILLTWASFLPAFRLNPPTLENGAFGLALAAYQLVLAPLIAAVVGCWRSRASSRCLPRCSPCCRRSSACWP